ncbi:MAG: hypothetical protein AAF541_06775 [Pseudomonadota bacterium]
MLARIAILALWCALVDAWLARHFLSGFSFDQLLLLAGVPLGGVVFSGAVDYLLEDDEAKATQALTRSWLRRRLTGSMLIFLYVSFAIVASLYTSVSIHVPEGEPKNRTLTLKHTASANKTIERTVTSGEQETVRLFLNPFAGEYELELSGYLEHTLTILPFVGAKVFPGDLEPLPTLLFRPSLKHILFLTGGGRTHFFVHDDDGVFRQISAKYGSHAWTVGAPRSQPDGLEPRWYLDLTARGYDPAAIATQVSKWSSSKHIKLNVQEIDRHTIVCVLVSDTDGKFHAGVVRTLGQRKFADHALMDIASVGDADDDTLVDGNDVCRLFHTDIRRP